MKKLFLYLLILSPMLSGCSDDQTSQKDADSTEAAVAEVVEQKLIMTSFYPLTFMTEQIVGDKAQVINMAGSTDVHDYEPSPQDLVKLNKADLVVFQGAELEPWTDGVIPELKEKGVVTVEVSHHLDLAKMEGHDDHHDDHKDEHKEDHHDDHKDEHKEDHHDDHKDEHKKEHHDDHKDEHKKEHHDDHKDEHKEGHKEGHHDDHKEGEHAGHDEHNHGEFDPHTWLDPVLAQNMVDEILESVEKVDPANEDFYHANAKALKARFAQLDQAYKDGLSNCSNEELILSHDAYGYLARRYNFEAHTISGLSTNDEPSAKILAELKEEAEEGITHILVEENSVRRFADTLARETGLGLLPANPLGRGTLDSQKDFFDVMEENLNSFKTALNCQ